jgi:hypothetical protein
VLWFNLYATDRERPALQERDRGSESEGARMQRDRMRKEKKKNVIPQRKDCFTAERANQTEQNMKTKGQQREYTSFPNPATRIVQGAIFSTVYLHCQVWLHHVHLSLQLGFVCSQQLSETTTDIKHG